MVERIHTARDHFVFFLELVHPVFTAEFNKARIIRSFHLDNFLLAIIRVERVERIFGDGIDALEKLTDANRERKRSGLNLQNAFNLVEQVEHMAAIQVHLVDERDNRRMAHTADIHQANRLLFNTVHAIDKHQSSVHGGQRTVRIFAEVLMPRGIDEIEHATFEREVQHGTRNRNTTLLFNLHPVTNSVALVGLRTHVPSLANHIPVPQELFGDGGFTGVRVADDGESAAFFNFWIHGAKYNNFGVLVQCIVS